MTKRYWTRFHSPGGDPRPVKVPAPCQWWCSGYGENDSTICAVVLLPSEKTPDDVCPWEALKEWWPDLKPSFCALVDDDWVPGDRFPHKEPSPDGYIERAL